MNISEISILCSDGIELSATCYKPETVQAGIMIGPATGIKQTFYRSFATFMGEQGYGVITYDNRGIGKSAGSNLNHVKATLVNWGTLDMTAVFERLKKEFPDTSYHLIGHSAGGQLVGIMDNALEITSMFNFASSSGHLKNMKMPFRLSAEFFMNVFIPISNQLFGYTKSPWVGMGEPLPKIVSSQWRKWCNGGGYIEVEFGKAVNSHYYNDLTMPSCWLYATDDPIANRENVEDMIRVFSKMPAELVELDPAAQGIRQIGHMNFFRSANKVLWQMAVLWIEKNRLSNSNSK